VHRLDMRNHGIEYAILRRCGVRCIGRFVALAAAEKQKRRGSGKKRAKSQRSHGMISVAAAKLT
jgi:hypothetical protein